MITFNIFSFFIGNRTKLEWSKKLGTVHHARRMGAMICILKIILAGDDFYDMAATQQLGVTDLFFFVYIYSYYWFAILVSADIHFLTIFWKDLKRWAVSALSSVCFKNLIYILGTCHHDISRLLCFLTWLRKISNHT